MAKPNSPVEVVIADAATAEVVEAFGRLLPQLSSSAARLTRESLAEIIGAPHNTVSWPVIRAPAIASSAP